MVGRSANRVSVAGYTVQLEEIDQAILEASTKVWYTQAPGTLLLACPCHGQVPVHGEVKPCY